MTALHMRVNVLCCDAEDCTGNFVPLPGRHMHPNPHGKPVHSGSFLVDVVTARQRAGDAGWGTGVEVEAGRWVDLCPTHAYEWAAAEAARRKSGGDRG